MQSWKDSALKQLITRNEILCNPLTHIFHEYNWLMKENRSLESKLMEIDRFTLEFQCEIRERATASSSERAVVAVDMVQQRLRSLQDLNRQKRNNDENDVPYVYFRNKSRELENSLFNVTEELECAKNELTSSYEKLANYEHVVRKYENDLERLYTENQRLKLAATST